MVVSQQGPVRGIWEKPPVDRSPGMRSTWHRCDHVIIDSTALTLRLDRVAQGGSGRMTNDPANANG